MRFLLFALCNATLFVRPTELIEVLDGLPVYEFLVVACLALAFPAVLERVTSRSLSGRPVTACVVGLAILVPLSHLWRGSLWDAYASAFEFFKVVLYFFLLVSLVRTPGQLRRFLALVVDLATFLTVLALLRYFGFIDLPGSPAVDDHEVDAEGMEYVVRRLCSVGIFNDPNDLALILVTSMAAGLYLLGDARSGLLRARWVAAVGLFGYALALTHSRGGFLALLAGSMVLSHARFGVWKSIPLAAVALPVMFLLFAGRQTELSVGGDTGQDRIQLWSQGLAALRGSPVFGIGAGRCADVIGVVAHNSFVHAFVELGFLGGALFAGAFDAALRGLFRAWVPKTADGRELARLRPFLASVVAAYAAGMMSLSRVYIVPTFLVLGLADVFLRLQSVDDPAADRSNHGSFLGRLLIVGTVSLCGIYVFIRAFSHWS